MHRAKRLRPGCNHDPFGASSSPVRAALLLVRRCTLLCSWYERRLRQLNGPKSRGGRGREAWSEGIAAAAGDRRKVVEGLLAHVLEIKALFASTGMVAQVSAGRLFTGRAAAGGVADSGAGAI